MRLNMNNTLPAHDNWNGRKHKLQRLFTWLTGYEIMFEGSRKDIKAEIPKK